MSADFDDNGPSLAEHDVTAGLAGYLKPGDPPIEDRDIAAAVSALNAAVAMIETAYSWAARIPKGILSAHDPDGPEVFGPFKIYQPSEGEKERGLGWAISYGGAWLPGRYADRDAALLACGYVLGGESRGVIDTVRDRAVGRLITVQDLVSLPQRPPTVVAQPSIRQAATVAGMALAWNPAAERSVLFEGGPWDGQRRKQPAVLAVDQHCMPRTVGDGELSEVWAAADSWPGQERYRPKDIVMGTGEVVMQWSHATEQDITQARQRRLEHDVNRADEADRDG